MVKLTLLDLNYILDQILMAEAGQPPVNPLLSFGLRSVDGTGNNLAAGQGAYGSTDQPFPTLTDPLLRNVPGANYSTTSGLLFDAQPRLISNLISDQTANNPAAVAAQAQQQSFLGAGYQNVTRAGGDGAFGYSTDYLVAGKNGVLSAVGGYLVTNVGADLLYGTADDTIVEVGADGVFGPNPATGQNDDVTGVSGTLLRTISKGADGVAGATVEYTVVSNGADGVFGTADDIIDEWGANHTLDGNTATSDDIIGTRYSLLHYLSAGADGVFGGTAFTVVDSGADGIVGNGDDTVRLWGANGADDNGALGGDDITGLRASFTMGHDKNGAALLSDDIVTDDVVTDDTPDRLPGPDGVFGTADDITTFGKVADPTDASSSSSTIPGLAQSLFINNVTPDNGLSAPSNSWFTFFGQFFDHGLDMLDKNAANGTVFIPLAADDPLYVPGGHANFMVLTRAQNLPGPDGVLGTADDVHTGTNQTSPFIDQSQTYASDSSHQVFLREYMIGADLKLHSTGALLGHAKADGTDGMATWADLKANAATFLGIRITDLDVGNVPLLATDAYGNFLRGPNGLPQLAVRNADGSTSLIEGNLAAPIALDVNGVYTAFRTGHAFLNDMAAAASPTGTDRFGAPVTFAPDGDTAASPNKGLGLFNADGTAAAAGYAGAPAGTYDNELLDAHYVAGDGRVNENIGLTAVQDLFHSEHDRLLGTIKTTIQTELNKGDTSFAGNWVLPGVDLTVANGVDAFGAAVHIIAANEWNGERLFQAAKFGTETQYQHLVFEEFARYVAPSIHVAGPVNIHINPAITSEFANVVYRFGHSMLDENVNIYQLGADGRPTIGANGQPLLTEEGLIQAFTNPTLFASNPNMTADLILGTVNQVSNSIDEFVTGSLRNNLLGLPLDLAALNITRGRDTGVAPLNLVRNQLYAETGEVQLKAYASWADFGSQLKHAESLVNFIAAYGTHGSITTAATAADKRAAAQVLVDKGTIGSPGFTGDAASVDAYNFLHSQGAFANATGAAALADMRTIHDAAGNEADWSTGSVTGVDNIDLWIGGLAEKISLFGGQLGSTFEYVFRTQLEALQDGDRLYYLPRIEGMDYEESLQDSSLAQLIRANTDIKHLPGNIFLTPEYTIESSDYFVKDNTVHTAAYFAANPAAVGGFAVDGLGNRIVIDPTGATWLHNPITGKLMVNVLPDGTVRFLGDDNFLGNTIVLGGTEGADRLVAGAADDDTIWGDGGNDYIDAGGGADFVFGGTGDDTLLGGQGDDTIHGEEGNDTILGGDGADIIFGGDGNDYIEGGRGDDTILGGLGNDIIIGGEGADENQGGEGDDWLESRGGQGQIMFGDSGAPTGAVPLYSGNDVMIGGVAGGDVMKGFSGDDIMVGQGSFTKFNGGLGFDWGSYEFATHGVSEDMNRKEFISPNGSEDTTRDIWQHTEGASGSQFDDIIIGDNTTKLLTTFDDLNNVNLITGLQSFFAPGPVSFSGGNILLGGGGSDRISGGAGNDIIEGDAFLHVALTKYAAGGQIIRQINYDPNANNFDPAAFVIPTGALAGTPLMFAAGLPFVPFPAVGPAPDPAFANLRAAGALPANPGNLANAANIDTAVFNDVFANYGSLGGLFGGNVGDPFFDFVPGLDAEGFLTINHTVPAVIVGGNPQGLAGINDGTDRIRGIERLQFTDGTVAIDPYGNILSWSFSQIIDPYAAALGGVDPYYDAVPVGTPTITESGGLDPATTVNVGQTLTANLTAIVDAAGAPHVALTDADGIATAFAYQWQYSDPVRGQWVDIATNGNNATFVPTPFFDGLTGLRVKVSYTDGKGYRETVTSAPTAAVSLAGGINTAPTIVAGQQFNGIANTTALFGQAFTFLSPFSAIFTDEQTAPANMTYKAFVAADGSNVSSLGLRFAFDPVTGSGEFTSAVDGGDTIVGVNPATGIDDDIATPWSPAPGQYAIRVLATDTGAPALSVASTFSINILPSDTAPIALNDSYTILEGSPLAVTAIRQGVLANDTDPDAGDRLTAQLVTGPSNGTLALNKNGTFTYTPNVGFSGADGFTYVADDSYLKPSNVATVAITVTPRFHALSAALKNDSGSSATDGITNDPTLSGVGFPGSAVFAAVDGAAPVRIATGAALPDKTGAWSGLLPGLADGKHQIVVTEANAAGTTDTVVVNLTLDTVAPPATVALVKDTGVSAIDNVTNDSRLAGTGDLNSTVTLSIDGGAPVVLATDGAGNWSSAPIVGQGPHTAVVVGNTDVAGNTGTDTLTFTFDSTGPAVAEALAKDTGASGTDNITNDDTIAGTGDPNAAVFAVIDGAAEVQVTTADAAGAWSFKPVLADGKHTVAVRETDLAGNKGTDSLTFLLDTVAPPVTVALVKDTGASATDGITSNPTLTGFADPFGILSNLKSSVDILVDGVLAGTVPTDATGKWLFTPVIPDGAHTIAVSGTDTAGNTATTPALAIVLDTKAPTAPAIGAFTYVVNAAGSALTNYTLSGTAEAGTTVTLSNGGPTALGTAIAAAGTGAWTLTIVPSPTSNINQVLNLTAMDLAGNVSPITVQGLIVGSGAVDGALLAAGPNFTIPNLILGLAANDTLTGGSGNDTLDGGAGNDTMAGGAGNDTYIVDSAADVVTEAAGAGTDTVLTALGALTLSANVENLTYTGAAAFAGTGNVLANVITGGAGADTLNDGGAGGDDTLIGLGGNDTYVVANAGDVIVEAAGGGTDTIRTTLNAYSLAPTAANPGLAFVENLTFIGAGNFAGTGNNLANVITGGAGNDTLDGGANAAGVDTLAGGAGNDTYVVRNAGDVVTEAAGAAGGTDTETTALAALTLSANVENLTYTGAGNFAGTGNTLSNVITGGGGDDTLTDGAGGTDTLIGGAGDDTYVVSNATDVITEAAGGGTDTVRTALAAFTLAANVENLTYTGAAAFSGTGNALANVITGGAGADTLNDGGAGGNDTLIGGAGNDTYVVANAGDVITEAAGGGTDTERTALAALTLAANVENLTFIGAGNFAGTGNNLANVITGGTGDDTLDGGLNAAGVDTLAGGAGNDTYVVRNAGDVVTEAAGGGTDTETTALAALTLSANVENLTYTGAGNFAGTGNNLSNVITGGAGDDTLADGAGGTDTLVGGAGNDTYVVTNATDVITEAAGGGTDTVRTALAAFTLAANVENLTYTGAAAFSGTGNALANVITGGAGADTLNDGGAGGTDTLIGGAGNDTYVVANAGDVITEAAGGGTDTERTALAALTLAANVENLTFIGAGSFAGTGNTLANVITGGTGDDTLDGGANAAGVDTLVGGAGNDTYYIRNAGDVITEAAGAGTDTALVAINTYTLATNVENMTFIGAGAFTGTGNALANVITGGAGNDALAGGAGADAFVMNAGFGNDIITDFIATANAGHDILDFSSTIFADFATFFAATAQQGTAVRVSAGANSLILNNVTRANLVAADFTTH